VLIGPCRLGVGLLSWSHDGRYLLSRNDNMASALWVWDMEELGLTSLIIQADAVRSARWSPASPHLAIATGAGRRFYLWSPGGTSWTDVPVGGDQAFEVMRLRWSPDGRYLALMSSDRLCTCTLSH
jgi:WD40 repeat protein